MQRQYRETGLRVISDYVINIINTNEASKSFVRASGEKPSGN